ncbi:ABC-type branched-subunit amino acid transport system ATPase component [Bradyrhizobium huanghuaihaiense]
MALSLAINDLDADYGAVALRGASLRVEAGETVALLGTNGNGKSTLMKCIAGLVRPQRGAISLTIDGAAHDLSRLSTEDIVELGVAMVPERAAFVSPADRAREPDARRVPQGSQAQYRP